MSSYKQFTDNLTTRLRAAGYQAIEERFPVAARELELNRLEGLAQWGRKSYIVCVVRSDGYAREQFRYLSDQFYNALMKESNHLQEEPTKLLGVCLFVFDAEPPAAEVRFLLTQARAEGRLAPIKSASWVVDLANRRIECPRGRGKPFDQQFVIDCMG